MSEPCVKVSVGSVYTLDEEGGDGLLEECESAIKKSPTVIEANAVFVRLHAVPGANEFGKLSQTECGIPRNAARGCSQPVGSHLFSEASSFFQCQILIFSNLHAKVLAF